MLTSAGANPGDSGGPVLDGKGDLIGVTYAVPADASRAKFTYHVHLDEVRAFIKDIPSAPMLLPPDPWDAGPRFMLWDDEQSGGKPDVLVAGGDHPEVLFFDLDRNTSFQGHSRESLVEQLVTQKRWDFELAIDLRGSGYAVFYDSDNDGEVDRILTTSQDAPIATGRFTRGAGGRWGFATVKQERLLNGALFKDPALAGRLAALRRRLPDLPW
jgi:hypothetical protein